MDSVVEVDVFVAGGGPVGMAAACELGRRGLSVFVAEAKSGFHEHPRSTVVNARTMEYFRKWGLDEEVLSGGVGEDYDLDVAFSLYLNSEELGRLSYPSIAESRERSAETLASYQPLACSRFGKTIIGQNALEPIIHRAVQRQPTVVMEFGIAYVGHVQTDDYVDVEAEDQAGNRRKFRAKYLIGCDGARSKVRADLGIKLQGTGAVGESVNIFFRSPNLLEKIGKRPAFLFWTLASGATGSFIAIDGVSTWVHSRHLLPHETYEGFDPAAAIQRAAGLPLEVEVISHWPWTVRELVADSYGIGRVYLAGDAAHLMSPTGGLGLNTGAGDIMNLVWKLHAAIEGWAGDSLLESYTIERREVAIRNSKESTDNRRIMKLTMLAGGRLDRGEDALEARAEIVDGMPAHEKHFDSPGLVARRLRSPVGVNYDGR